MPSSIHQTEFADAGFVLVDHFARVPEPRHSEAGLLIDYWRAVMDRGDGFIIGRDIPARPIARILRSVVIYEPLADRSDLRIRLAGAAVRRRFSGDIHGKHLSDLFPPADFRNHLDSCNEVLDTALPIILDSSLKRGSVEEMHVEVVLLPIADRDRISPLLLVGIFYFV